MSALEAASKEWRVGAASRPMHTTVALTEDGLVLGTGTVLAKTNRAGGRTRGLALEDAEDRVLALLSVAYRRPIGPGVFVKLRLASDYSGRGETTLALIALAQTGLPPLPDPEEAAFRLFLGERALAHGVDPGDLIEACSLAADPLDLDKAGYNPDQPRVPGGNPQGGQWTRAEGDTIRPAPIETVRHGLRPRKYQVVKETPADAKVVVPPDGRPVVGGDPPKQLLAPPGADFRRVYAAGQAIASLPPTEQFARARSAIAQEGTYDFQRDVARLKFYSAYNPGLELCGRRLHGRCRLLASKHAGTRENLRFWPFQQLQGPRSRGLDHARLERCPFRPVALMIPRGGAALLAARSFRRS